ncbi:MAG: DUF2975 domain-containing protein [Christensenellaceae bacterium]|nr:DUF2975 domain-containing protein [Christensenellaceae bacterium]
MSQKNLSVMLRMICIVCCFVLLYMCGYAYFRIDEMMKEVLHIVLAKLIVAVCAVVVAMAIFFAWAIFADIGRDRSFTMKNAVRLKMIAWLFLSDSLVFLAALAVVFILKIGSAGLPFVMLLIIFIGISLTVICACLSHLIAKAAAIEQENELTI